MRALARRVSRRSRPPSIGVRELAHGARTVVERRAAGDRTPEHVAQQRCIGAVAARVRGRARELEQRFGGTGVEQQVGAGHPLGRAIRAEDCAEAAVFLCSDESSNITGILVPVDGGYVAR